MRMHTASAKDAVLVLGTPKILESLIKATILDANYDHDRYVALLDLSFKKNKRMIQKFVD